MKTVIKRKKKRADFGLDLDGNSTLNSGFNLDLYDKSLFGKSNSIMQPIGGNKSTVTAANNNTATTPASTANAQMSNMQMGQLLSTAGTAVASTSEPGGVGTVVGRAGQLAGMGSMFGPIGAGIGAAAGIGLGLIENRKINEEKKKQEAEENKYKAKQDFYQGMQLAMSANPNGTPYGGVFAAYGAELPGTVTPGGSAVPLAEDASKMVGATHEQGGIDIGVAEVENQEVIYDNKVFSDRLEESTGRTFAKAAEFYAKHKGEIEEKIQATTDVYKRNAYSRILDGYTKDLEELFARQEAMKQQFEQQAAMMQQMQQEGGQPMMAGGGWLWPDNEPNPDDPPGSSINNPLTVQPQNNVVTSSDGLVSTTPVEYQVGAEKPYSVEPNNDFDVNAVSNSMNNKSVATPAGVTTITGGANKGSGVVTSDSPDWINDNQIQLDGSKSAFNANVTNGTFKAAVTNEGNENVIAKLRKLRSNPQLNEYLARTGTSIDNLVNDIIANKTPNIPVPEFLAPAFLNTNLNVDKQVKAIKTSADSVNKTLDENVSNSVIARANKIAMGVQESAALSDIYSQKELAETTLKNQSIMNVQGVMHQNATNMDKYKMLKTTREAGIWQDKSANAANAQDDLTWNVERSDKQKYQAQQLLIEAKRTKDTGTILNFRDIVEDVSQLNPELRGELADMVVEKAAADMDAGNKTSKEVEAMEWLDPDGTIMADYRKKKKTK